ncbi:centrosomal protein of 192 kDa-like [Amphiura filiformis]|uniref:centrosomal protein of 192 kDa-like n=1 Tax=Amphiura filiformis TaxID=82378 RepID=UPI003B218570
MIQTLPQPSAAAQGLAATGMIPSLPQPSAAAQGLAATGMIPAPSHLQLGAAVPGHHPVLMVPDHLRFKHVCCLGIASQSLLPLHNSGSRWLQCTLEIVSVTSNGEEISNNPPVFIIKNRTILSPHNADEMKILFAPHQPGLYQAHLQVGCSPVVAETGARMIPLAAPQMVLLTAFAERPNVEFDAELSGSATLDFGEMGTGISRSKRIHIVNRGRSTVPVRLLLRSSSSRHYFSLTAEAEEWGASSTRPTHIKLEGKRDGSDTSPSTTVWVHFKVPPDNTRRKLSDTSTPPDSYSAKLEAELDVPGRQTMTLASLDLKAVSGIARLHAPTSMQAVSFSSTVGRTVSRNLPLKNAGTIRLDIGLQVTRASELFSILPEDLQLDPGQESDVLVKYTPKEAPSVVESMLIMQIKPDGAKYEVVLRGEATARGAESATATAKEQQPILLCNKQFIAWGGVPLGRALQQKVVLRNSSKEHPLKLRVSIRGDEEFQLQSHFSSGENSPIILNPSTDLPVHLLFAPTQVSTCQATLTIKQSGTGIKYSVPLSGYGGVSKLLAEDVDSIGDTYTISAGPVTAGREFIYTLKVRNSGPRAAFVKVLGLKDLRARFKLPISRLSVEPSKFVLNSKQSCKLTLRYLMSDRNAAACMDRSSVIAVVGFFYGDEIFRQHYKKSLQKNDSIKVPLPSDDPLRGVSFEDVFLGENQVAEECDLPLRPNDQQLFYSCMSRMMVTLVGSPLGGSETLADLTLTDITTPMATTGKMSKGQSVPYTPPVRDNPQHPTPLSIHPIGAPSPLRAAVEMEPDGSQTWNIVPERLILEAPHVANGSRSDSKPPVLIINYTNRKLRFEITWPGGVLSVSPQYGVIEPKSNIQVLVSPRRSILSKGLELPWSGHLQVRCDGKQKEVGVQIRQDVVLDTSIHPAARSPQALQQQLDSVTPYVTKEVKEPSQGGAVRVKSKHIKFPRTKVETTSEASLEFQNTTNEEMKWCLSSFAPAYVKQDEEVFRTTYSVFRFARQSGSLGPEQKIKVILTFIPRDEGSYSQFWDLESHGLSQSSLNPSIHGTRIELLGEAYKNPPSLEEISLIPKKKNTPDFQMNPISLKKDVLEFDIIEPCTSQVQKLVISNSSLHTQEVHFRAPNPPFHIKHSKHSLKARHFTSLPITFKPSQPGKYEGTFVIECVGHRREAKLCGECQEKANEDIREVKI